MKTINIILFFMVAFIASATAQAKVNDLLLKGAIINSQLNNLGTKADSTKSSLDKLKGLFHKKDKGAKDDKKETVTPPATAAATTPPAQPLTAAKPDNITTQPVTTSLFNNTIINVIGIDFPTLQTLNENIKVCSGVQTASFKFNTDASVITINHSGTTTELFKIIQETSKKIFTAKNVSAFEEGKITLKL